MGKIADAYVEIGANTSKFRNAIESLKEEAKSLFDRFTGIEGSGRLFGSLISSGFGKAIVALGAAAAAVGVVSYALDQLYSRDDDQKFSESVKGWTSGFRGLNEEVKRTDEKIKAIMERDATGGNGGWVSIGSWKALFERLTGVESMSSQVARNMNNAATASKLFADNMVKAAVAGRDAGFAKQGAAAAAGLMGPAGQREEQRINAAAFQRIMDAQGGIRVEEQVLRFLRQNPDLVPRGTAPAIEAKTLTGALMNGDLDATRLFGDVFDIASERAKVLAEEFDEATGRAEELARIEKEAADEKIKTAEFIAREQREFDRMIMKDEEDARKRQLEAIREQEQFRMGQARAMNRETDQASREWLNLQEQQGEAAARLAEFEKERAQRINDSFMFADLRTARNRLFTAAVDNRRDDLTASKMKDEVTRIVDALGKIQAKWGLQ